MMETMMARSKPGADEIIGFHAGFARGGSAPSFSSEAEAIRDWIACRPKGGSEADARSAQSMIKAAREAVLKQTP
jgi:hypothetical protein